MKYCAPSLLTGNEVPPRGVQFEGIANTKYVIGNDDIVDVFGVLFEKPLRIGIY